MKTVSVIFAALLTAGGNLLTAGVILAGTDSVIHGKEVQFNCTVQRSFLKKVLSYKVHLEALRSSNRFTDHKGLCKQVLFIALDLMILQ